MKVKGLRDTKLSGVIPVEGTELTTRIYIYTRVRAGKDMRTYEQWWKGLPDVS